MRATPSRATSREIGAQRKRAKGSSARREQRAIGQGSPMTIGSAETKRWRGMRVGSEHWGFACAIVACLGVTSACGSDHETKSNKSSGVSGKAGTSAHSAGSSAGAGGSTAGSSSMTLPRGPRTECGTFLCTGPMASLSSLFGGIVAMPQPCCFDAEQGTCGYAANSGSTCEAIAVPDDRCPSIDLTASAGSTLAAQLGVNSVAGCCMNNMCGVDGALFGRGCIENSEAKVMLSGVPLIGGLVQVPDPQPCE
jgi:hypothetical protein